LYCPPDEPLPIQLALKPRKIDFRLDFDEDKFHNLDDLKSRDVPITRRQLDANAIMYQIIEDEKVIIPIDIINFELDKFFVSVPIRSVKEVDIWMIAFQELKLHPVLLFQFQHYSVRLSQLLR